MSSIAAANAQMKAGKLRALACFGAQRAPALPDVPTMKELGYNVEFSIWVGLFAPKGTPAPVIATLRDATQEGGSDETVQDGDEEHRRRMVAYLDQAEFKAFWDADARHASNRRCSRSARCRADGRTRMDRRQFVVGSAATTAAIWSGSALAQEPFPSRAVTIVNAFPPGGANDLVTRPIADRARSRCSSSRSWSRPRPEPPAQSARRSPPPPSRTATRCSRTTTGLPATPRWTSCSAGNPRRPARTSFRSPG